MGENQQKSFGVKGGGNPDVNRRVESHGRSIGFEVNTNISAHLETEPMNHRRCRNGGS